MNKTMYILLPVHNRKKLTLSFVQSLKRQSFQDFTLILIDDASTDGTAEEVEKELTSTIILKGNGNHWWAGSLQLAIDHLKEIKTAPDTFILIINDDTVIADDFLAIGLKEISANLKSVMCASSNLDGKIRGSGVNINWVNFGFTPTEDASQVNCLPTRGIFLRFSDVINIGGFRPFLLPHYLSDYEFTYRAHVKGYKLISPLNLFLSPMLNETGIRTFNQKKGLAYLRLLFSKRCVTNPVYLSIFIIMASPIKYKIRNLYDLFLMTSKGIIKNLV